jgi:hypothetical protein
MECRIKPSPPTPTKRVRAAISSPDGDFGRLVCTASVFDWPGRSAGALLTINLSQNPPGHRPLDAQPGRHRQPNSPLANNSSTFKRAQCS